MKKYIVTLANKPTEDVILTKVDNVTAEEKECATEEKTEQTNAPAKVVPLDKPSNKFSFDAVGVNVGDAWCSDVVEEWVKRIEHDKNNDVDYVIDTSMFGVIENDQERKSSDFHVSFYYRG